MGAVANDNNHCIVSFSIYVDHHGINETFYYFPICYNGDVSIHEYINDINNYTTDYV